MASDDVSSVVGAESFQPSPKALPLPSILSRVSAPRIRSPFQVTDLHSMSSSSCAATVETVRPSTVVSGLARPTSKHSSVESLPFPEYGEHTVDHVGLLAPAFSHPPPTSLLPDAFDNADIPEALHSAAATVFDDSLFPLQPKQPSNTTHRPLQAGSNLTRVRIASKSPIVLKLWSQFFSVLHIYSTVLQQMAQSQYMDEHAERFLNQYAATTLVRYMTSVLQFVQLCRVMHVTIADLTEAQLADLLICGSLARRSDGSGPKCSITIKALRWCCKQLGIQQFASAFGSLISSFERQKLPTDRKESLPFPLFILMKWERRVLQAQATIKEIIILGGFLLLCWSGLRFSDMQRTSLTTWFLDERSLRGLTWRAKTCNTSTPFGVVLTGLLSQGNFTWVHRYLQALDHVYADQPAESIDFAIPAFQDQDTPVIPADAMTYAEALYHVRYFMQLPWSQSSLSLQVDPTSYTVHGLKATLLSWAAQADLSPEDRRMHGKHKAAQMSVQLYSRDDIIGSLRLQQALIEKISQGWRPSTPLGRGGQAPLLEPDFSIEKFKKSVTSMQWRFFSFSKHSSLQLLADSMHPSDVATPIEGESDTDSSSDSSSDSSDSVEVTRPSKTQKTKHPDPMGHADECVVGLHRKTWHMMMASQSDSEHLPIWQGFAMKTACGRSFPDSRIQLGTNVQLETGQALCSHVGCRKGFSSLSVSD